MYNKNSRGNYKTKKQQRDACPTGYMLCPVYGTCRPTKEIMAEKMYNKPYALDFEGETTHNDRACPDCCVNHCTGHGNQMGYARCTCYADGNYEFTEQCIGGAYIPNGHMAQEVCAQQCASGHIEYGGGYTYNCTCSLSPQQCQQNCSVGGCDPSDEWGGGHVPPGPPRERMIPVSPKRTGGPIRKLATGGRTRINRNKVVPSPSPNRSPEPCLQYQIEDNPEGWCICMTNWLDPYYGQEDFSGEQQCCPYAGCNPSTASDEQWYRNCDCFRISDCPPGDLDCCYTYQCNSCGHAGGADPFWFLLDGNEWGQQVYELCWSYNGIFSTCASRGLLKCPPDSDFPGTCVTNTANCYVGEPRGFTDPGKTGARKGGMIRRKR